MRSHSRSARAWCLLGVAFLSSVTRPPAQGQAADRPLDRKTVEARLAEVEASEFEAALKEAALKTLRQVLAEVEAAEKARLQASDFEQRTRATPELLAAARVEGQKLSAAVTQPLATPDADLVRLEQLNAEAEAARKAAAEAYDEAERQAAAKQARLKALPDEIAKLRQDIGDLTAKLQGLTEPAADKPLEQAQHWPQVVRRQALVQRLAASEAEQACYLAQKDLTSVVLDVAAIRRRTASELADRWQKWISEARQGEAERAARGAREKLQQRIVSLPEYARLARENDELARRRTGPDGLTARVERAERALVEAEEALRGLQSRYRSMHERLQAAGLSQALGQTLRNELRQLEAGKRPAREARQRHEEIGAALLAEIELDERRRALGDPEPVVARIVATFPAGVAAEEQAANTAAVREAVRDQQALLEALRSDSETLANKLQQIEAVERRRAQLAGAYRDLLREHILWVPSVTGGLLPSLGSAVEAAGWLVHPAHWRQLLTVVTAELPRIRLQLAACLAGLLLLVLPRRRIRRELDRCAERVAKHATDSFGWTLLASALTLVLAAPIPFAFWCLGSLLAAIGEPFELAGLPHGLRIASVLLLPLLIVQQMTTSSGLLKAHFRWPPGAVRALRRAMRWYVPVAGTLVLVSAILEAQPRLDYQESLGRLSLAVAMLVLTAFLWHVVRPDGPVLGEVLRRGGSLLLAVRWLWFPLAIGLPVVLALASLLGYDYTARVVWTCGRGTLLLILGLALIYGLLMRWLFVARRRIAVAEAMRRLAADAGGDRAASEASMAIELEKAQRIDIFAIDAQTRQLFRAGLAIALVLGLLGIWAEILPALRFLDRFQVWPELGYVAAASDQPAAGAPALMAAERPPAATAAPVIPALTAGQPSTAEPAHVVTLADLGLLLLTIVLAVSLTRNVPALLEIMLLHLPIDRGSRYAVATVVRYLIAIAGTMLAFGCLGVGWQQVQWLVAALTFGLAFGLQEIFANFVSGLILLFERPIRVGDLVTIGGVEGQVIRIDMRATAVENFDRRVLIVPNRQLITERVINWTLTDAVNRLVIRVGIAYGSDTARVEQALQRVAREHPLVLQTPAPQVMFVAFGESTLDFELRVFYSLRAENSLMLRHELNSRIHDEFARAGIVIPFPQRDLHVRTLGALGDVVERSTSVTGS
jgi:potassium efflux system protein